MFNKAQSPLGPKNTPFHFFSKYYLALDFTKKEGNHEYSGKLNTYLCSLLCPKSKGKSGLK